MKILILGGTWNDKGGKASSIITQMYNNLKKYIKNEKTIEFFNGGYYNELSNIIKTVINYDVVLWLANVPNNLPKIRNVKEINPNALLIGSKRNINNEYSFVEILNRSLIQKHNLSILFSKENTQKDYYFTLFDPLGTEWYEGKSIKELTEKLFNRISFLLTTTRRHTFKIDNAVNIPNNEEFFEYVRDVSKIFHQTIQHTKGVTRFMGNASFKGPKNIIYVSERDVDKSLINIDHFVAAYTDINTDKTYYFGNKKPSKDTIVQTYLYNMFPNINYMIHSHCYIQNGPFTEMSVPCGSLDEIDEIKKVMKNNYNNNYLKTSYKFNLKGHGMLIMASTINELKQAKYYTRNLPEKIY